MVCGYEHDSMGSTVGEDARVIQCLQDYRCACHWSFKACHWSFKACHWSFKAYQHATER